MAGKLNVPLCVADTDNDRGGSIERKRVLAEINFDKDELNWREAN